MGSLRPTSKYSFSSMQTFSVSIGWFGDFAFSHSFPLAKNRWHNNLNADTLVWLPPIEIAPVSPRPSTKLTLERFVPFCLVQHRKKKFLLTIFFLNAATYIFLRSFVRSLQSMPEILVESSGCGWGLVELFKLI